MKYILFFKIFLIASLVAIISCNDSSEKKSNATQTPDKSVLIGNWLRTDAGYRILIPKVNENGTLDAQYFNPNPINVAKANWGKSNNNLKVIVELRDVNYPGSTYTLNYLPDRDMLAGEYYQAVEGLTFYVEFMRRK